MIVVRLFTVFIITGLLTGCDMFNDVAKDVGALRHDIEVVKAYLRTLPAPNGCLPAGTPQSRLCFYKLTEVQPFKDETEMYIGHVAEKDVQDGYKSCMEVREKILKDFPSSSFKCQDPATYQYVWFGFKMKKNNVPPDLGKKDFVLEALNVPGTVFLRPGKADEVVVANP